MAKKKTTIGYISKGKVHEGKQLPDSVKITKDVSLKKGQYLKLESKKSREEGIKYSLSQGWIDQTRADELMGYLNDWADYKRFELVVEETQ